MLQNSIAANIIYLVETYDKANSNIYPVSDQLNISTLNELLHRFAVRS